MSSFQRYAIFISSLITLSFWLPHEDGFNLVKFALFVLLCILSVFHFVYILMRRKNFFFENRTILLLSLLLICIAVTATLNSDYMYRSIFGEPGRYMGLLSFAGGVIFALSFGMFEVRDRFKLAIQVFYALGALGVLETSYSWLQYFDRDPLKWQVPYGSIVGTLSNANFAGAFIGLCAVATAWLLLFEFKKTQTKILASSIILLELLLLFLSNVRQGLLIAIFGISCLLIFSVRRRKGLFVGGILSVVILFGLNILGMLQIGPLSNLIYKSSISIRGDYWRAALRMIFDRPLLGYGPGRFGDFFAQYRDVNQVRRTNGFVLADSAHNSFLDLAVNFGITYFLLQLTLVLVVVSRSINSIKVKSEKEKNALFGILTIYLMYLFQASITIETITMLTWSSVFIGILYSNGLNGAKKEKKELDFSRVILNFGLVVSLVVTSTIITPMWRANSNLRKAQILPATLSIEDKSRIRLSYLEEAVRLTNKDSFYSQSAARILLSNNQSQGINFAINAIALNPLDLRSLVMLYSVYTQAGNSEKANYYLEQIQRLDPLSPLLGEVKK